MPAPGVVESLSGEALKDGSTLLTLDTSQEIGNAEQGTGRLILEFGASSYDSRISDFALTPDTVSVEFSGVTTARTMGLT
jgi:hypothetical protein